MTGNNYKDVGMVWTVIVPLGVKYHHEQMKCDSSSSYCSKMNIKVCQPGDYAGGSCNEGVNLIYETDDKENSKENADVDINRLFGLCIQVLKGNRRQKTNIM
eukprot:8224631-Ditylum_brightwellii.AAC.1